MTDQTQTLPKLKDATTIGGLTCGTSAGSAYTVALVSPEFNVSVRPGPKLSIRVEPRSGEFDAKTKVRLQQLGLTVRTAPDYASAHFPGLDATRQVQTVASLLAGACVFLWPKVPTAIYPMSTLFTLIDSVSHASQGDADA